MKKSVLFVKKYHTNILGALALFISVIQTDFSNATFWDWLKLSLSITFIVLLIFDMLFFDRNYSIRKEKLIKKTKDIMKSVNTGKIVMFGGDISWAYDYLEVIRESVRNQYNVDIIFPETKLSDSGDKKDFCGRIDCLRSVGAKVFTTKEDIGLRATLVNVEKGALNVNNMPDTFEVISSCRKGNNRNKYYVEHYKKEYDENQCKLKYIMYLIAIGSEGFAPIEENVYYMEYREKND